MSPVYSVPYFSGAALLDISKGWQFAPEEVNRLQELEGWDIYFYKFDDPKGDIWINTLNNTGYLYLVAFASLLFPFLGPIGAITLLQLFAHLILSFVVYGGLTKGRERNIFLMFYFANPVVIYFVIFPFYYFWQVIPSAVFLFFYLDQKKNLPVLSYFISLLLCIFALFTRPTVVLLVIFFIIYCIYKYRSWIPLFSLTILIVAILIWNHNFNMTKGYGPWHTAYVGIGAYPNDISGLYNLSDNRGYDLYERITGKRISASIEGEYSTSVEVREDYLSTLKDEYFKIVKEKPLMIIRNALLNGFQGYGLGYINGAPYIIHVLMALAGFVFFVFLSIRKYWFELLAIGFSHASFTFFYPPIQNYYYGTILLIVVFFIRLLVPRLLNKIKSRSISGSQHSIYGGA